MKNNRIIQENQIKDSQKGICYNIEIQISKQVDTYIHDRCVWHKQYFKQKYETKNKGFDVEVNYLYEQYLLFICGKVLVTVKQKA